MAYSLPFWPLGIFIQNICPFLLKGFGDSPQYNRKRSYVLRLHILPTGEGLVF